MGRSRMVHQHHQHAYSVNDGTRNMYMKCYKAHVMLTQAALSKGRH